MARQKRSQTSPLFTGCSRSQKYCSFMYEHYRASNSANTLDRLLVCLGNIKIFLAGQRLASEEPSKSKVTQTAQSSQWVLPQGSCADLQAEQKVRIALLQLKVLTEQTHAHKNLPIWLNQHFPTENFNWESFKLLLLWHRVWQSFRK